MERLLNMRARHEASGPIVPGDPEQPGTSLRRRDVFDPRTVLHECRQPGWHGTATLALFCYSIRSPSLLQPGQRASRWRLGPGHGL